MRVNPRVLEQQVNALNRLLNRPTEMFAGVTGSVFNIGHIAIDKNAGGYQLEEMTNANGAVKLLSQRVKANEMTLILMGMLHGIHMAAKNDNTTR